MQRSIPHDGFGAMREKNASIKKAVLLSEIALPKYAVQVLCLLLRECLDSVSGLSKIFGSIDDSVLSNQSAMYPAWSF